MPNTRSTIRFSLNVNNKIPSNISSNSFLVIFPNSNKYIKSSNLITWAKMSKDNRNSLIFPYKYLSHQKVIIFFICCFINEHVRGNNAKNCSLNLYKLILYISYNFLIAVLVSSLNLYSK